MCIRIVRMYVMHERVLFIQGELCLVNGNDGTEHRFKLRGVAEKPLAQDHALIHTRAKTRSAHTHTHTRTITDIVVCCWV